MEYGMAARARFRYGPAEVDVGTLLARARARAPIAITDDAGRVWRFPNVNGDTRILCREVATERDLLTDARRDETG